MNLSGVVVREQRGTSGVLIAVGLSVLDMLRRVARPHDGILGYAPGVAGMHDIDDYPTARQVPGLVVYRYDAPLFFANAQDFKHRALASLDEADGPVEWLILNAEANVEVDLTSVDALDGLREELQRRDVVLVVPTVEMSGVGGPRGGVVEVQAAGAVEGFFGGAGG